MLIYNGAALEDIAPAQIVDITVSPVKQKVTSRSRAILSGEDFVRIRGETRTIKVTFALLTQDADARAAQAQAVRRWSAATQPQRLLLPDRQTQYINAVCTAPPEISIREWWKVCNMTFTAYDPFFADTDEHSVSCGTGFEVSGSSAPDMRIQADLLVAVPTPSWIWNDQKAIFLSGAVGPGHLIIDLTHQTITLDGVSIMTQYKWVVSDFFAPQLGFNVIDGRGRVYWRERWE